ncbi:hypothetical protein BGZ98_000733, partial [Dissophora globulifera]
TRPKVDISVISNASLCQLLKQKQGVGYMMDVSQLEELSNVEIHDGPEIQLPAKYQEYAKVFSKQEADKLPPHRPYDHAIPIAHESLYNSPTDKILFAISRLGSRPAFKYMQNFIPSLQKPLAKQLGIITDYDLFSKTMAEHFGQQKLQNVHLVAEVQMRQLHQKGSALDYTNKFMELATDVNWNDEALIAQYRMGLKDCVQDTIGEYDEPKTFVAFCEKATDINK